LPDEVCNSRVAFCIALFNTYKSLAFRRLAGYLGADAFFRAEECIDWLRNAPTEKFLAKSFRPFFSLRFKQLETD